MQAARVDVSSNVLVSLSGTSAVNATVVNVATISVSGVATVSVSNTPNVSVINTPSVSVTNTPSVNATVVNQSTVSVAGTVGVSVNNTPTVTLGASLPAGTNYVGNIQFNTPTLASLSSTVVDTSATGDNVIVSTQSAQTVRIFRMFFVVSAATTITLKSGGSAKLTGTMTFNAGGAFVLDFEGEPWFITAASQAFIINQTGTAQISGLVQYTQS
jgi:hypothetical protein